ncbi:MAG: glycosyltransferase [Blastocatellia bacterium]|nr:glycosyltransferase [Blastocatellia bacterium]
MNNSHLPPTSIDNARVSYAQRLRAARRRHAGAPYAAFREMLRVLLPHRLRRSVVQLARGRFGLLPARDWVLAKFPALNPVPKWRGPASGDFFEAVTLLPHIPPPEVRAILERPLERTTPRRPDIICFSIIDWSFRFQRPQQLMQQFAAAGHRVFYLNISDYLTVYARPRFAARPMPGVRPEIAANLFDVRLSSRHALDLFSNVIPAEETDDVLKSLDELRRAFNINEAVGVVMIPSWGGIAREAQQRWGWRIVYDCMDEWENFPGVNPDSLAAEKELVERCDLLVVTAQRLYDKWKPCNRPMVLARNAADFEFYSERCRPNDLLPETAHPIIGYFGAIADWFDVALLAEVARARPAYTFVLLGGVFEVDVASLRALPNVRLLGQQPYETMPQYLHHFDACVIPFKINSITEATDPVKLYEYLSGGKPVISVRLPELTPYRESVYLADTPAEFAAQIDRALAEDTPQKAAERKAVARQHTWRARCEAIAGGLRSVTPRASVIIVTYNNLALTKLCLESVLRNTEYPDYEVIVVDNRSADETPAYLKSLAALHENVSIILNTENYGFARANNQALARATGDYLVLLNNDTIVPSGWLSRLLHPLRDPTVGIVGPMTNFVGNEAKLDVDYATWREMEEFTHQYTWSNDNLIAEIHMLAMFCLAMRRDVYERIGPLDEQFGIGMFEDDDYSVRVRAAGLRVVCAAGAFLHHFGQAAFGKLIESGRYNALFDQNRALYEKKWGVAWTPHRNAKLEFKPHRFES